MIGLQHPACYARPLGGCCRKMTGEHYISESVLELVYVRAVGSNTRIRFDWRDSAGEEILVQALLRPASR